MEYKIKFRKFDPEWSEQSLVASGEMISYREQTNTYGDTKIELRDLARLTLERGGFLRKQKEATIYFSSD